MPLLDIRNLTIEFRTAEGWVKAVDRVSMRWYLKTVQTIASCWVKKAKYWILLPNRAVSRTA